MLLDLCRHEQTRPTDAPALLVTVEAHAGHTAGYVALLEPTGASPLYDMTRRFLDPIGNRVNAWGNGTKTYAVDLPGVYEAESRWHNGHTRRHWFAVDAAMRLTMLPSRDAAVAACWDVSPDDLHARRLGDWTQRGSRAGWIRRVERAVRENDREGLPPLHGTPKQIDYAEVIRAKVLAQFERIIEAASEAEMRGREHLVVEAFRRGMAALRQVDEAQWWIENRRRGTRALGEAGQEWVKEMGR